MMGGPQSFEYARPRTPLEDGRPGPQCGPAGRVHAETPLRLHTSSSGGGVTGAMVIGLQAGTLGLPVYVTRFVGRESDVQALRLLLSGARDGCDRSAATAPAQHLLTLVGPGGCGKTRLAAELARLLCPPSTTERRPAFARLLWVDLGPVSDDAGVSSALAWALHLRDVPNAHSLRNALKGEPTLLVLDNCELVARECAGLLGQLLPTCPDLVVLASSRVPLHAAGEHAFLVPPLGTALFGKAGEQLALHSEATRLFLDRAGMVMPGYELLGENVEAVNALCHRLDGSPLAIELAASWIRVLSAHDLLVEVNRNLDILASTAPTVLDRHRSLRAVLDSSWRWLDDRERQVMQRLSVFVGSFSRAAAVDVAGASLSSLLSLAEKSLIQRLPETASGTRYRLHQVVRDYGLDRLVESPLDADDARSRLLNHLLAMFSRPGDAWDAGLDAAALDRLAQDQANLISVLQWAVSRSDVERALRLSAGLFGFWMYASPVSVYTSAVEAVLALPWNAASGPTTAVRAMTLCIAAYGAVWASDFERARQRFAEAEALYRELGDERMVAWSLSGWGYALTLSGAPEEGQRLEERSMDIVERLGDQRGLAWANHDLGEIAFVRGDLDRAQRLLEEGQSRFDSLGLAYGSYRAQSILADVYRLKGEWLLAVTWYERSLALQQQTPTGGAEILEGLAQIAAALQRPALAARLFGCGHAWRQTYGLSRFYFYEVEHSRSLTLAQAQIRPDEWLTSYTAGWHLRPEQAVEEARRAATELGHLAAVHAATGLTSRQREIVRLVAEGLSNVEIAARLVVSHRTVDAHLRSIFERLGVATRMAAVHEAERLHLI